MSGLKTVLGIDLGTQSLKVLFYDFEQCKVVCTASSELELDQDANGKAEQHAVWWIDALISALQQIDADIKSSVCGVAVSGQQHGFVAIDDAGDVLAPVKLWCDTSTGQECQEIMQAVGGEARCVELSGNKIVTGFTAPKVLHLKKHSPEQYARLATILLPHDYLNFWLTGKKCMEMGDASGTGFLDVRAREWCADILQAIDPRRDLSACLPTLRTANEAIGYISALVANKTGLPDGVPVAIGGGDNMMGAIGTGNLQPGRTTISLGTSGTIYTYSDKPVVDLAGNIAAFCSSTGGWLPLLCIMNCTVGSELMRGLFDVEISEFDPLLANAEIGSDGVITLPFFNGERTPDLPNAKACVLGLDSNNTTRANIMRSVVEGASFALRFGLEELRRLGVGTTEVVLTGGGANSAVWRQMIADVMGVPVLVMKNNEGAAYGAALQAYSLIAREAAESENERLERHYQIDASLGCTPSAESTALYDAAYKAYQKAAGMVPSIY